jgi:hypothetical protein
MLRHGGASEVPTSISGGAENPASGGSYLPVEQRVERRGELWGEVFFADAPVAIPAPVQSWRTRNRTG